MDQPRLQFGGFELNVSSYELRRAGLALKLERIPMELLILLVERRGELVTREMIIQRLWGEDVFLETEHSINTAINKLRAVLQDHPRQPVFVQTVIGKGYRFIADVQVAAPAPGDLVAETRTNSVTFGGDAATGVVEPIPVVTEIRVWHETSRVMPDPNLPTPTAELPLGAVKRSPRSVARTVISIVLLVVLAATLGYLLRMWREHRIKPAVPVYQSVAVLPFTDLSADSGEEYLVDGMTDEVITLLARGSSLRVVSRTSTMQYKGVRKPLAEIAVALRVDAVVEGSVTREGGTVRITAQLLDARHDQHLWAQTYQQRNADPLLVQDQVAAEIAREVARRLGNASAPTQNTAASPYALELYLRGR